MESYPEIILFIGPGSLIESILNMNIGNIDIKSKRVGLIILFLLVCLKLSAQMVGTTPKAKSIKSIDTLLPIRMVSSITEIDSIPNLNKPFELSYKDYIAKLGSSISMQLKPMDYILIVNGFIIRNKKMIQKLRKDSFLDKIRNIKSYSSSAGYKKFGIRSADGILFVKLKRNVIIDLKKLSDIE